MEDLGLGLDELPGWDSVQLLAVLVILERNADAQISLPALLEAGSLESIYQLVHA
ncbi:hypothetical protein FRAAL4076 [Frankia alni ACN14a]|uniref:Carrier domain-containing protein n=1 Tax=Frankia alni (strain DSM 45986 / CECT 9034 / ACN14a) TaxID=326424 RepID=Q0RIF1_FRAAA|nr:hypothetical protein FRAAL4076 [Frankia alni ACN14a]